MSDDDRRPDGQAEFGRLVMYLIVIAALILLAPTVWNLMSQWAMCQQLSPAERFFTRGC